MKEIFAQTNSTATTQWKKSAAIRIQSAQTQMTKTKRTQKMIFMVRKIHVEQSMNTIVHFRPFDSLIRFSALFFTFVFSSVFFFLCVLRFNFFSLFLISFFFYYSARPFRRRHNAFRNSFRCLSSIKHRKASWICVANKQCVFVRFSLPSRSFISRPFLIFSLLTLFSVGVFLFAFFFIFFFRLLYVFLFRFCLPKLKRSYALGAIVIVHRLYNVHFGASERPANENNNNHRPLMRR